MSDKSHSDSTLGIEAELSQPARRRHLNKTRIEWADPAPGDKFAKPPKGCPCRDALGYRRKRHEHIVECRDGVRCCWCGSLLRAEKL